MTSHTPRAGITRRAWRRGPAHPPGRDRACQCRRGRATPAWVQAIRAGLALVLLWPWLTFTLTHVATHHTLDGLLETLVIATLDGTLAWTAAALQDPAPALAQALLLSALTAAARPRHRH